MSGDNYMGGVYLAPNIKPTRVRINTNGDIIDPITKQVIQEIEPEFVAPTEPTPEPIPQIPTVIEQPRQKSIKELIADTEATLAQLKELRKQEIERMKAELAELENGE